ncbi:hypothetical protein [Moorena producens]|uniref:hypothetical protein n=1 Tax=Moorena producens TaxID=1155739 RepID=UPI003C753456
MRYTISEVRPVANLILNGKSAPKILGNREQRITGTADQEPTPNPLIGVGFLHLGSNGECGECGAAQGVWGEKREENRREQKRSFFV